MGLGIQPHTHAATDARQGTNLTGLTLSRTCPLPHTLSRGSLRCFGPRPFLRDDYSDGMQLSPRVWTGLRSACSIISIRSSGRSMGKGRGRNRGRGRGNSISTRSSSSSISNLALISGLVSAHWRLNPRAHTQTQTRLESDSLQYSFRLQFIDAAVAAGDFEPFECDVVSIAPWPSSLTLARCV